MSPWTWIVVPLLGGVIGYLTNYLAVRMIFRPIRPVSVLGLRVQGLVARRQGELAASIGRVVGDHLLGHDDIARGLKAVDLEGIVGHALDRGLAKKVENLRSLPLVGGFLTDERIQDLRDSLVRSVVKDKDVLFEKLEEALEQGLDVHELVREKVAAFPVEKLEALVLEVASRELRTIEVLGGVLGVAIGVAQVLVLLALG